ncbi:MAG: hypothetical protein IID39_09735, partial [Planctomycetes bacterium]|nr:hypothetical protein [Planctomycetota bacterium]
MSKIILFEDAAFANLLPLVYWRTVFELRCGRMTLEQRAARANGSPTSGLWTRAWIADVASERFDLPINKPVAGGDMLMNGRWLADDSTSIRPAPFVGTCDDAIAYVACDDELAKRLGPEDFLDADRWSDLVQSVPNGAVGGTLLRYPWDLVTRNADFLDEDWCSGDSGVEGEVHASAVLLNPAAIRIERGARVMPCAVLDASDGPIVLEQDVTIRPHACIFGPAHIGSGSIIHPHANIHGGTTIGPGCKIGGEVDACIFQGFANKAHEGFLGHSYVGSWTNL